MQTLTVDEITTEIARLRVTVRDAQQKFEELSPEDLLACHGKHDEGACPWWRVGGALESANFGLVEIERHMATHGLHHGKVNA